MEVPFFERDRKDRRTHDEKEERNGKIAGKVTEILRILININ